MPLVFTNTRTRKKELFKPLVDATVRIYTCGPTLYNVAHIGNFMAYIDADLAQRYLRHGKGYTVQWVMNITDVDDKTIRDSKAAYPDRSPAEALTAFTRGYEKLFMEDLGSVGIEKSDIAVFPRATEHITEMQEMIRAVVANGYGYEKERSVYFNIQKYHDDGHYGELIPIDFAGLKAGVRIDADEYAKDHVQDFALWKAAKEGEPHWEFDFEGKALPGRPGWHIECSAMSCKYLGKTFDMHTGGIDLVFPHHENEIAQNTAANGVRHADLWLHNEHLQVDGRKMAKRDNNFYTLRDILEKGYTGSAFRMLVLSAHYRSKLNFTFDALQASVERIERINELIRKLKRVKTEGTGSWMDRIQSVQKAYTDAMDDDLNTPEAWAVIITMVTDLNSAMDTLTKQEAEASLAFLTTIHSVMNVFSFSDDALSPDIEALLQQRAKARTDKDFDASDRLRKELL